MPMNQKSNKSEWKWAVERGLQEEPVEYGSSMHSNIAVFQCSSVNPVEIRMVLYSL